MNHHNIQLTQNYHVKIVATVAGEIEESNMEENIPGGGTFVTALQTAQHTDVAPCAYRRSF